MDERKRRLLGSGGESDWSKYMGVNVNRARGYKNSEPVSLNIFERRHKQLPGVVDILVKGQIL